MGKPGLRSVLSLLLLLAGTAPAAGSGREALQRAVDGAADLALRSVEIETREVRPGEEIRIRLELVALAPRSEPVWVGALLEGERLEPLGPVDPEGHRVERSGLTAGQVLVLETRWPLSDHAWPGSYRVRFGLFASPGSAARPTVRTTHGIDPALRVRPAIHPSGLEAEQVQAALGEGHRLNRAARVSGTEGARLEVSPGRPGRRLVLLLTMEGAEAARQGEVVGTVVVETAEHGEARFPLRAGVHVSDRGLSGLEARHRSADRGLELPGGGWAYRCDLRLPRGGTIRAIRLIPDSGGRLLELLDAVIR